MVNRERLRKGKPPLSLLQQEKNLQERELQRRKELLRIELDEGHQGRNPAGSSTQDPVANGSARERAGRVVIPRDLVSNNGEKEEGAARRTPVRRDGYGLVKKGTRAAPRSQDQS